MDKNYTPLKVTPTIEPGGWQHYANGTLRSGRIAEIGGQPGMTQLGNTVVGIMLELEDGSHAVGWTTHALFSAAAIALEARHGRPNG